MCLLIGAGRSWLAGPLAAALLLTTPGASAADDLATNRVAVFGDWSVFVEVDPAECFATTLSFELTEGPKGQAVPQLPRPSSLMITIRPEKLDFGEIAYLSGTGPLAPGGRGALSVEGLVIPLGLVDGWAWPLTPDDDARATVALARAAEARVTVPRGDGVEQTDVFSLRGFAQAAEEIARRCAALG